MTEEQIADSSLPKTPEEESKLSEIPDQNRKRMSSKVPWIFTGILVVVIISVIVFAGLQRPEEHAPQEKKLANVEVITVSTENYIETLTLPALVKADRVAAIRPEFSGTLERWFFPSGVIAEKGQVVAELDTEVLKADLKELEAFLKSASINFDLAQIGRESAEVELESSRKRAKVKELALKSAQADLNLTKIEFKRIQNLVAKRVLNSSKLDTAQNALTQDELLVAQAKEEVNNARLGVRSAEVRIKESKAGIELADAKFAELEASIAQIEMKINKSKLRAPFSGRIEEHLAEPGEIVAAGTPLAYIYDLKHLRAIVNVPDRYVAFLDPKNPAAKSFIRMNMPGAVQRVSAKLIVPGLPKLASGNEPDIELYAEIARIAQSSDPESNTFKVELRLPNPGGALRHGVIARGKIEYLHYPRAIIIPVKAVQVTDAGPRVLVLEEVEGAQSVRMRDIEPISIQGSELLIGNGLAEGDQLIVAGWKGLVGGETVNVLIKDGRFTPQSADSKERLKED